MTSYMILLASSEVVRYNGYSPTKVPHIRDFQGVTRNTELFAMVCCRCNRSGHYRGCACVKAKKTCVNCLPSKLGHCANRSTTNGNSTSGELSPRDPPRDPSSAINPANVHADISHPQTVSDHEPSSFQLTDSISDLQNPDSSSPPLPEHLPMNFPTFTWGNLSGPEFAMLLDTTYDEVVHWRRNCFSVPFGKAGREFVSELSRLYLAYGSASTLEAVALKAATVLPILLLQKPSKRSKTKHHTKCLERRLAS